MASLQISIRPRETQIIHSALERKPEWREGLLFSRRYTKPALWLTHAALLFRDGKLQESKHLEVATLKLKTTVHGPVCWGWQWAQMENARPNCLNTEESERLWRNLVSNSHCPKGQCSSLGRQWEHQEAEAGPGRAFGSGVGLLGWQVGKASPPSLSCHPHTPKL